MPRQSAPLPPRTPLMSGVFKPGLRQQGHVGIDDVRVVYRRQPRLVDYAIGASRPEDYGFPAAAISSASIIGRRSIARPLSVRQPARLPGRSVRIIGRFPEIASVCILV